MKQEHESPGRTGELRVVVVGPRELVFPRVLSRMASKRKLNLHPQSA